MTQLLPFPPPFRAWLALSNDPDNTTAAAWQELHDLIWEELELPFADSIFLRSVNDSLPDQISAESHPHLLDAHPFDTLHTWGDYILSQSEAFHRGRAREAVEALSGMGVEPRVWVDHSFFEGNLLGPARLGSRPSIDDASGHSYENTLYTLDLARQAGVRYVWDQSVSTAFARPGRETPRHEFYAWKTGSELKGRAHSALHAVAAPLWRWVEAERFDYVAARNRVYYPWTFEDGQTFYCFPRYGTWPQADIRGFGELLEERQLRRMVEAGAACIVYTHLGKRHAEQSGAQHVPESTRASLRALRDRYAAQEIMVSSTSRLLDYCVLRDHARVEGTRVDFVADGVRWQSLAEDDLSGFRFGLPARAGDHLEVLVDGQPVDAAVATIGSDLSFTVGSDPVPES